MTLDRQPILEQLLGPEAGPDDDALAALCRQIDVKKTLDGGPADAAVVAAQLLRRAAADDAPGHPNAPEPFGLKCLNSALKALDLHDADSEHTAALRAWALELLDAIAAPGESPEETP